MGQAVSGWWADASDEMTGEMAGNRLVCLATYNHLI